MGQAHQGHIKNQEAYTNKEKRKLKFSSRNRRNGKAGLYDAAYEKDACGMGFVVDIKGRKSHDIIDDGLRILERLEHRGARGADASSGDGAGILVQIPHDFFRRECEVLGFSLPPVGSYGVGMVFAHRYETLRNKQKAILENIVREEGQVVLGWREVPVDSHAVGAEAAAFDLGSSRFLSVKAIIS